MSDQPGNGRSRRIWTADEVEEQLDQIGEMLARGASEFVKGFLFGAPSRRKRPEERRS